MLKELRKFIKSNLETSQRRQVENHSSQLTIGVEHEFFLLRSNGEPADHNESQDFLHQISKTNGWKIYQFQEDPSVGRFIGRVSKESEYGFCALKYDHHPHLLEIAFQYTDNLYKLNDEIKRTFANLNITAENLGLKISKNAFLDGTAPESTIEEFVNLRGYRKKILERSNQQLKPSLYNYAASIAATQIHIGGTCWWENEKIVGDLYSLEPEALYFSYLEANSLIPFKEFMDRRWKGYKTVFKGYPLVGYPNINNWSFDSWTESLVNSPLFGPYKSAWAGDSWNGVTIKPSLADPSWLLKSARDLSIIRPKIFGTLEFRADPSMQDAQSLMKLAALRLGLTNAVLNGLHSSSSYQQECYRWYQVQSGTTEALNIKAFAKLAIEGLKLRHKGEENFLLEQPNNHSSNQKLKLAV